MACNVAATAAGSNSSSSSPAQDVPSTTTQDAPAESSLIGPMTRARRRRLSQADTRASGTAATATATADNEGAPATVDARQGALFSGDAVLKHAAVVAAVRERRPLQFLVELCADTGKVVLSMDGKAVAKKVISGRVRGVLYPLCSLDPCRRTALRIDFAPAALPQGVAPFAAALSHGSNVRSPTSDELGVDWTPPPPQAATQYATADGSSTARGDGGSRFMPRNLTLLMLRTDEWEPVHVDPPGRTQYLHQLQRTAARANSGSSGSSGSSGRDDDDGVQTTHDQGRSSSVASRFHSALNVVPGRNLVFVVPILGAVDAQALLELQHWSAFCAEAIALLGQVRERERLRVCDV